MILLSILCRVRKISLSNKYGTDSIDMSGLTPYDYRHYLEKLLA